MINWIKIVSASDLEAISKQSYETPQVIFKHSTTCPISSMALRRLEKDWDIEIPAHFLDLLAYRSISNQIEETFDVVHESPQVLVISHGKAIHHDSHLDINVEEIRPLIQNTING